LYNCTKHKGTQEFITWQNRYFFVSTFAPLLKYAVTFGTYRQFHQHFLRDFFVSNIGAKNYKAETKLEKAAQFTFVQKSARKMLMKLIPTLRKNEAFKNFKYKICS